MLLVIVIMYKEANKKIPMSKFNWEVDAWVHGICVGHIFERVYGHVKK